MILIVCGGRDYADWDRMCSVMDGIAAQLNITLVRHGAARGADRLADRWARSRGIVVDPCPADWAGYGKAAGPRRNAAMLMRYPRPDGVVAFPGGRGTADMIGRARAAGLPVKVV